MDSVSFSFQGLVRGVGDKFCDFANGDGLTLCISGKPSGQEEAK